MRFHPVRQGRIVDYSRELSLESQQVLVANRELSAMYLPAAVFVLRNSVRFPMGNAGLQRDRLDGIRSIDTQPT